MRRARVAMCERASGVVGGVRARACAGFHRERRRYFTTWRYDGDAGAGYALRVEIETVADVRYRLDAQIRSTRRTMHDDMAERAIGRHVERAAIGVMQRRAAV